MVHLFTLICCEDVREAARAWAVWAACVVADERREVIVVVLCLRSGLGLPPKVESVSGNCGVHLVLQKTSSSRVHNTPQPCRSKVSLLWIIKTHPPRIKSNPVPRRVRKVDYVLVLHLSKCVDVTQKKIVSNCSVKEKP